MDKASCKSHTQITSKCRRSSFSLPSWPSSIWASALNSHNGCILPSQRIGTSSAGDSLWWKCCPSIPYTRYRGSSWGQQLRNRFQLPLLQTLRQEIHEKHLFESFCLESHYSTQHLQSWGFQRCCDRGWHTDLERWHLSWSSKPEWTWSCSLWRWIWFFPA